jgi:hypothetical protein
MSPNFQETLATKIYVIPVRRKDNAGDHASNHENSADPKPPPTPGDKVAE